MVGDVIIWGWRPPRWAINSTPNYHVVKTSRLGRGGNGVMKREVGRGDLFLNISIFRSVDFICIFSGVDARWWGLLLQSRTFEEEGKYLWKVKRTNVKFWFPHLPLLPATWSPCCLLPSRLTDQAKLFSLLYPHLKSWFSFISVVSHLTSSKCHSWITHGLAHLEPLGVSRDVKCGPRFSLWGLI